jgi:aminodeoxyfutalosine synthase
MIFEFEDINLKVIEEKVRAEERLSFDDGVALWDSFDLLGVGYLSNIVRERMHSDDTYFIHNRHINHTTIYTNISMVNVSIVNKISVIAMHAFSNNIR